MATGKNVYTGYGSDAIFVGLDIKKPSNENLGQLFQNDGLATTRHGNKPSPQMDMPTSPTIDPNKSCSDRKEKAHAKNKSEATEIPIKWREGHRIGEAYAFSATAGALNMAPPIIIMYLILGTFVNATFCEKNHRKDMTTC